MFKKILAKKRPLLAVLGAVAVLSLTLGVMRPLALNFFYPDAVAASAAKKQLPIYCVDTRGEKKVAISFDAAWGEGLSGSSL